MSWAEFIKINDNLNSSINEQIREYTCQPLVMYNETTNGTISKNGIYKIVVCGGNGCASSSIMELSAGDTFTVTVSDTQNSITIKGNTLTATSTGTVTGGDVNYNVSTSNTEVIPMGNYQIKGKINILYLGG